MDKADRRVLDRLLPSVTPGVDLEAIWQDWQALQPPYIVTKRSPPKPVWARRPFSETGEAAWQAVQQELADIDCQRGICLYVHIPFCAEKCAFCDCYSFRLRHHHEQQAEIYSAALIKEIKTWGRLDRLVERPVSTVHFGGGTPLFIGARVFTRIVESIRHNLNIRPDTEWALETTSSALDDQALDVLDRLGFSRIHVGVQSLVDPVRILLKRQETSAQVLEKIKRANERDRVVSVDLIYGLPQQTLASLIDDLHRLAATGVEGFSLYPLQVSSRNRKVLEYYDAQGKNQLHEYLMLQVAEQVLLQMGYRKTLFNHYARRKDTNLYFTFPERDEDCLALGTIADGVIGSYHYRHPEYRDYLNGVRDDFPGLQGGLRRNALEEKLRPLEVQILSAEIQRTSFGGVLGPGPAKNLFERWLSAALIRPVGGDNFKLTANGSWFAAAMIRDLSH
jgi:coproporphyrinogen III oxidase-like Fe-S oxidoreductase